MFIKKTREGTLKAVIRTIKLQESKLSPISKYQLWNGGSPIFIDRKRKDIISHELTLLLNSTRYFKINKLRSKPIDLKQLRENISQTEDFLDFINSKFISGKNQITLNSKPSQAGHQDIELTENKQLNKNMSNKIKIIQKARKVL